MSRKKLPRHRDAHAPRQISEQIIQRVFDNYTPEERAALSWKNFIADVRGQLGRHEGGAFDGKEFSDVGIRLRVLEFMRGSVPIDKVPWQLYDRRQAWIREIRQDPWFRQLADFFNDPDHPRKIESFLEALRTATPPRREKRVIRTRKEL